MNQVNPRALCSEVNDSESRYAELNMARCVKDFFNTNAFLQDSQVHM